MSGVTPSSGRGEMSAFCLVGAQCCSAQEKNDRENYSYMQLAFTAVLF